MSLDFGISSKVLKYENLEIEGSSKVLSPNFKFPIPSFQILPNNQQPYSHFHSSALTCVFQKWPCAEGNGLYSFLPRVKTLVYKRCLPTAGSLPFWPFRSMWTPYPCRGESSFALTIASSWSSASLPTCLPPPSSFTFIIQHSSFNIHHSSFDIQHSKLLLQGGVSSVSNFPTPQFLQF